jgi:hypothetical protein
LRLLVLPVARRELARPELLVVVEHVGDEVDELLVRVGPAAGGLLDDTDVVEAADTAPPPPDTFRRAGSPRR